MVNMDLNSRNKMKKYEVCSIVYVYKLDCNKVNQKLFIGTCLEQNVEDFIYNSCEHLLDTKEFYALDLPNINIVYCNDILLQRIDENIQTPYFEIYKTYLEINK